MKRYFIHNVVFRLVGPIVYGFLVYLLVLLINNNVNSVEDLFNTQEVYVCIGLTYISMESCRVAIRLVERIFPIDSIRKIIIQVITTTAVSILLVMVALSVYFNYVIGFAPGVTELRIFGMLFLFTALIYNTLYLSNYYLHKENTLKLNMEKQQREMLEMEMNEFRNEINPDLLYESLESLIALMYRDTDKAEEYIDCLSSTYRYVLANRHEELSPLSDEITAAKNIIRLINERYHGQIILHITPGVGEDERMLIPGALPMTIENLVRNTIVSRFEPLTIQCYAEDDYLIVQSKLNDRLLLHPAHDHTLKKLEKSYGVYSNRPLIKIKAYQDNYIKLPLITLNEEPIA